MELDVKRVSDREIIIIVSGEGHTLGNMIAKEALQHPHVVFATYRIPHPLQDKMEITIIVDENYSVDKALHEIIGNLKKYLREFKERVEEVL